MDRHPAIGRIPPAASAAEIQDWLIEQARPDLGAFAILDGSQREGLPAKLKAMMPPKGMPLFSQLGKPALDPVGPWLLPIEFRAGHPGLVFSTEMAWQSPSALWFQSPLPPSELPPLLAKRLEASLDRGRETYLRYYDPRIFTNLAGVLKREQAAFLSMAPRWLWLDHAFHRCVLEAPLDIEAAKAFASPLKIDPEQERALIEGSLPYEVQRLLEQDAPQSLASVPPPERYGLLKQGVDRALAKGQRLLSDLALACLDVLSETYGEKEAR